MKEVADNADTPSADLLKTLSQEKEEADNADILSAYLLQTLSPDEL